MNGIDEDTARLSVGLDFARRLRDRPFRTHLTGIGWRTDMHVVPALDDEPVSLVVARMMTNGTPSPCLIVVPSAAEEHGFALMFATRGRRSRWRRTPPIAVAAESSIGMLYAALGRCGEYIPSEWSAALRFEKIHG